MPWQHVDQGGIVKAYKISCVNSDHGAEILFAERGVDLRGRRTEVCDCDYLDLRVLRAPEFDTYSPGPLTPADYMAQGWHFVCAKCERRVYDDMAPIILEFDVFCSVECVARLRDMYAEYGDKPHWSVISLRERLDAFLKAHEAKQGQSAGAVVIDGAAHSAAAWIATAADQVRQ